MPVPQRFCFLLGTGKMPVPQHLLLFVGAGTSSGAHPTKIVFSYCCLLGLGRVLGPIPQRIVLSCGTGILPVRKFVPRRGKAYRYCCPGEEPITNYQLPITNYQLPITNYQFIANSLPARKAPRNRDFDTLCFAAGLIERCGGLQLCWF
jgi:hypothetical protein